ncbi:Alcohol acetyltransferase [Emydomyces testavorans]|uniref:Alcohol acetyltransferase n=1 Tax=Emydomyces testavorans TaxID=2070801 RepID=A0AAF0DIX6_9EURO|nr:Alcohol acetyltransferase [Emydomyces testavorans]
MPSTAGPLITLHKLEKLRSVGKWLQESRRQLEKYSTARHHLGFYYNVAVSAVYSLSGALHRPLKGYIHKACGDLICQHPILSAVPVGEDCNDTYFVRLPKIDLNESIFFEDWDCSFSEEGHDYQENSGGRLWERKLDELLQTQHNTAFAPGLPVWRLYILTDGHIKRRFLAVFVYHHAIGDGSSGKAFHASFLQALTGALSLDLENTEAIVKPPNTPLLPSLESLHSLRSSLFFILKAVFNSKIWSRRDPRLWTGGKMSLPLKSLVHHIALPAPTTTALKHLCREHRTTITATLQTLLARALFARLPGKYTKLRCTGAISTRRWFSNDIINDHSIGVWVQDFAENYTREFVATPASFPWAEAQRSRETIEAALRRRGKNTNVGLLKFIKDYHGELLTCMIGKERSLSFEVSNIGVFNAVSPTSPDAEVGKEGVDKDVTPASQRPKIDRMIFSQSANVVGSAVNLSVITGGDGCLVLTFSWQEGVVEAELMASVMEQLKKEIDLLLDNAH